MDVRIGSVISAGLRWGIGVAMAPGATLFTPTPLSAYSRAADRVRPAAACFAAQQALK